MSKLNNATKLLAGLAIGTAIGAVVGLLYAPESGKDTRKKLKKEADKYKKELDKYANDFSDKAKQTKKELEIIPISSVSQIISRAFVK